MLRPAVLLLAWLLGRALPRDVLAQVTPGGSSIFQHGNMSIAIGKQTAAMLASALPPHPLRAPTVGSCFKYDSGMIMIHATLRRKTAADSRLLKLEMSRSGSGRKIPVIWHGAGTYHGGFPQKPIIVLKTESSGLQSYS